MKVLWFTNTPSLYNSNGNVYNGGGWISSLELLFRRRDDIELAISFMLDGQPFKKEDGNVVYYPIEDISPSKYKIDMALGISIYKKEQNTWATYEDKFLRIVNDFNPDIIQVFGSEQHFGLISSLTKIPVILHIIVR